MTAMAGTLTLVLAFTAAVLSVGRLTRLVTQDTWPPVAWWRTKWDDWTEDSGWNDLFHCPFCLAPWIAAVILAWGWLTDLHWTWWAFNLWLAISYLASILVYHDEGKD